MWLKVECSSQLRNPDLDYAIDFYADLLILLLTTKNYSKGRRCRLLETSLDIVVGAASDKISEPRLAVIFSVIVELEKLYYQAGSIIVPTLVEGVEHAYYVVSSIIGSSCKKNTSKFVLSMPYFMSGLVPGWDRVLE